MKEAIDNDIDNHLFISEFDNHYKSVVKDNDYFIAGSINWLSIAVEKIMTGLGKMNSLPSPRKHLMIVYR